MSWVLINGKEYYEIQLNSSKGLLFTKSQVKEAIKRDRKVLTPRSKIWVPKELERYM